MAANPGRAAAPVGAFDLPLRVSARADYAIRALTEMAASGGGPITAQRLSDAQAIPLKFLLNILAELRRAGLVQSRRGPVAGYALTRPARNVTLEDIIRAIEGDLSGVHGTSLEKIAYPGAAGPLRDVWLAVRSSLSAVLATVTLADIAEGNLPPAVRALARRSYPAAERASP